MSFSRRWTTDSAASFSDTKRTVLPFPRLCAMRLVMVWLLPVPGGPSRTRSRPASMAQIAFSCDESDSNGARMSCGRCDTSRWSNSPSWTTCANAWPGFSMRCFTTRLAFSCSLRSWRSFHIRYLVKEKIPRLACSSTSHLGISAMASRNACSTRATSRPLSSRGSVSSPVMRSSKLVLSNCRSVGLTMASSSCRASRKPARTDWRCNVTGINNIGALCTTSVLSTSVHCNKPMARYRVLAPPSSRPMRAAV